MKGKSIYFDSSIIQSSEDEPKTWFLGIAVNNYKEYPILHNAVKDMDEVSSILREEYDLKNDNCYFIRNEEVTAKNVHKKLEFLKNNIPTEDSLIIYYSGHGRLDHDTNRGFWLPYDAEKSEPSSYIRNQLILEYLEDIKAKHILLICDSCFAASIANSRGGDIFQNLTEIKSRWALFSGRHNEVVLDGNPGENSPFAKALLDTLKNRVPDKMNISELGDIVQKNTISRYNIYVTG